MERDLGKVLIIGAGGMLGSDVRERFLKEGLREGEDLFPFTHASLDITDAEALMDLMEKIRPKVVINCAAYTDVDGCESDYKRAFKVNGYGPRLLARLSKIYAYKLVHISTDYIFDGRKGAPYTEEDAPNPVNVYGRSKLEGERGVLALADDYLIVRTAWLFGKNGRNFVRFVVERVKEGGELKVIYDQVGSPTYTKDLAEALLQLLKKSARGVFNVVNEGSATRYEIVSKVIRIMGMDAVVEKVRSEDLQRPARRPSFTVLSTQKLNSIGIRMRNWEEAVEEYVREIMEDEE